MDIAASNDVSTREVGVCRACGQPLNAGDALSVGRLPACNRFSHASGASAETWPLTMNGCTACSLVQLSELLPVAAIVPQVPFIRYNEPEAHLDHLADQLATIFPACISNALGMGPFDKPLLDRLAAKAWIVRDANLLSGHPTISDRYPYLETLQAALLRNSTRSADYAPAELVCCRYLLEHCDDPVGALRALKHRLAPNGQIMIEVPDCSKFLARNDYSFVWEEHVCYFTDASFRALADFAGFKVSVSFRYAGLLEDALVYLLLPRQADEAASDTTRYGKDSVTSLFPAFREAYATTRQRYRQALVRESGRTGKIALFGAGHQSIMFANLFGPSGSIAVAVDDHPQKLGCNIPGTDISIISTEQFDADTDINICLLGVNPAITDKIFAKTPKFLHRGGRFFSIFPAMPIPTLIDTSLL